MDIFSGSFYIPAPVWFLLFLLIRGEIVKMIQWATGLRDFEAWAHDVGLRMKLK